MSENRKVAGNAGAGRLWRKLAEAVHGLGAHEEAGKLGDFTTTPRVLRISVLAIGIGILSAFVALGLLRLIGLFTNLFFFQRVSGTLISPTGNGLGYLEILVPVAGGVIVGLMARYGSEKIRGHGIPEAIESILINGSRVEPRLAFLKPIASAIAIGSGGPFGAEGPIIMTGSAFGSMIAQFFRLSSAERKTLLVAGAAGGMAATFASPVAAVLIAVEVLLFEWKPRSVIPVALASVAATATRRHIIGLGPLFPVPSHSQLLGLGGLGGLVLVGLLAGILSVLVTEAVYAAEDAFRRLPIHWMWWPALGGVVVGLGGLMFPQALGVGYDIIADMLQGHMALHTVVGILVVKSVIWAIALGSGTSGGTLAPLLLMGGALGGLEAGLLPNEGAGFWSLISMTATLGGTLRAPLTAVVFAFELTHDVNALFPLLVSTMISYSVTVLVLRRSILTEKVARRGYHLSNEYAVDPLEILFVREVMRTKVVVLPSDISLSALKQSVHSGPDRGQLIYPVVAEGRRLVGLVTRNDIQSLLQAEGEQRRLAELIQPAAVVAYPDEPLRVAVYRMAETGKTRLPVVDRSDPAKLVGLVSLNDLLMARARNLQEERRRERVLRLRLLFPRRARRGRAADDGRAEVKDRRVAANLEARSDAVQ